MHSEFHVGVKPILFVKEFRKREFILIKLVRLFFFFSNGERET